MVLRKDLFKNTLDISSRDVIEETEAKDAFLFSQGYRKGKDSIDMGMRNIMCIGSSATGSDLVISDLGTNYSAQTYAAGKVKVSAANAADTAAGTGARTVRLYGLDANYAEIYEDVTLNGLTEVLTTQDFIFVRALEVLTAGSGGANAGIIYAGTGTVTSGAPATKWLSIVAGMGMSAAGIFVVPAGYTAHLAKGILRNTTSTNVCTLSIFTTLISGNAKVRRVSLDLTGSSAQEFDMELSVPEKTLIVVTGNNATSTSVVKATLNFRLIKNS